MERRLEDADRKPPSTYSCDLLVPEERQGEMRVPVPGATRRYAVKQLGVELGQGEALGASGRATLVVSAAGCPLVVGVRDAFRRGREERDRVPDPREDLVAVVEIGQKDAAGVGIAVVVVRGPVAGVAARGREALVDVLHHGCVVDAAGHAPVALR